MKRLSFKATLLEDTAVSADPTSTGGHKSLNYIPGIKFLGVVARQYEAFGPAAWDVFHSGAVRFSDAHPLHGGARSLPLAKNWTDAPFEFDLENENDPNLKEARGAFFAGGKVIQPRMRRRQKTANSRQYRGAVLQSAFFDLNALAAGQEFAFNVSLDLGQETHASAILAALCDGPITVGRSRSAEFGLLKCEPLEASEEQSLGLSEGSNSLDIYCAADIDLGFAGKIDAGFFGLPSDWDLVKKHSFLRTRNIPHFNAHRKLFTTQHTVLEKGSVLRFEGPSLNDEARAKLETIQSSGVGHNRAMGFGELMFSPSFLTAAPKISHRVAATSTAPSPSDALFQGAQSRAQVSDIEVDARDTVRKITAAFKRPFDLAREEAGVSADSLKSLFPARSQWGRIRTLVQGSNSRAEWQDGLFGTDGIATSGQSRGAWSFPEFDTSSRDVLGQIFAQEDPFGIWGHPTPIPFAKAVLINLASEMPRTLETWEQEKAQ